MTKLIALAALATYVVQSPLDHDGKHYPIGSPIELDAQAAQPLLDVQVIGHADANAAQALQAANGGEQAQRTDEAGEVKRLRVELLAANATIQGLRQEATDNQIAATTHADELRQFIKDANAAKDELQTQLTAAQAANAELQAKLAEADAATADLRDQLANAIQAAASTGKPTKKHS